MAGPMSGKVVLGVTTPNVRNRTLGLSDHWKGKLRTEATGVTRSRKSQDRLQGVKSQASAFRFRIDRHRSDTALFDQLAENRGENRGQ